MVSSFPTHMHIQGKQQVKMTGILLGVHGGGRKSLTGNEVVAEVACMAGNFSPATLLEMQ
jgi:hypothetical protein